jgi:predicted RNA methylase
MIIGGTIGLLVDIVVFIIVLFLLYALSMVWPPDSPWAPWWQMPKDKIRKMYKMVGLKSSDTVYELGCGIADAMVIANNEFKSQAVGIEIDPLRIVLAKINVWRNKAKVKIIKNNFFHIDLSDATVLIIYLVPKALGRLVPKLFKELKKGTRIVSYKYKFPTEVRSQKLQLIKEDTKNEIYFYKIV